MQFPVAKAVMVLPTMLQIVGVFEVNVTALPEAPPVAETVSVPPTIKFGATPKLMICGVG
jgi:hypothetical protein